MNRPHPRVCSLAPWRHLGLLGLLAALALPAAADWPPTPRLTRPQEFTSPGLPPSVTAASVEPGRWSCTFRVKAPNARRANLAGTFNQWDREATPMNGPDAEGWWGGHVVLDNGVYEYKFVLDGREWIADPQNPAGVPDGHQGQNSVLRLGRIAQLTASPATVGDSLIETLALEHNPSRPLYFQRLGSERALLRYRTLSDDVETVAVAVRGGGLTPMTAAVRGPVFTYFEAEVDLPLPRAAAPAEYTFVVQDGTRRVTHFETFDATRITTPDFTTPEWARHAVWYQIMVDRFRNGTPENDPPRVRPWRSEWFTPSPWEQDDPRGFYGGYVYERMYGGDFQGVLEQLGYLKELGVNALYFNPVFQADTHHKYNATSFIHIDDRYGVHGAYERVAPQEDLLDPSTWQWSASDRLFLDFLKQARAMGFRVILDGVFNHVGTEFPAFVDVQRNGRESRFADWFDVVSWEPFRYNGWAGHDELPAFKKSATGFYSPQVRDHIFNVTRRWMDPNGDGDPSDGIDGWRLDVPMDVPMPFWVEWRQLVKSINPAAYIVGEVWDRADDWRDGTKFDAVMNYQFSQPTVAWIFNRKLKITATQIDQKLAGLRMAYPHAATAVLQNLMGSHDTDRVASMAFNPDRLYDRGNRVQEPEGRHYNNDRPPQWAYQKARLAALLQMTYVGAPMIYYGDEVGMWGADDPTCRKPMLWDDLQPYDKPEENFVDTQLREEYRRMIRLRHAHPSLRTGGFQTLLTDDAADVWVFRRFDASEELIVALNAGEKDQTVTLTLPGQREPQPWHVVYGGEGTVSPQGRTLELRVPATAGVVLRAKF